MDKRLRILHAIAPLMPARRRMQHAWMGSALLASALLHPGATWAATGVEGRTVGADIQQQVRQLAQQAGARAAPGGALRLDIEVGELDPRLRLAPCPTVRPYLPTGARPWGRTRVGLRCIDGRVRWNVYLPVTVKVMARGLVAATALPAGTTLGPADLREAEVDLAAGSTPAVTKAEAALGRTLARGVDAGEALEQGDLRARHFFQAGDTVQLVAVGAGYQVSGEARALGPGLEGQSVKVRTDSGRIVSGTAAGERRVEVAL